LFIVVLGHIDSAHFLQFFLRLLSIPYLFEYIVVLLPLIKQHLDLLIQYNDWVRYFLGQLKLRVAHHYQQDYAHYDEGQDDGQVHPALEAGEEGIDRLGNQVLLENQQETVLLELGSRVQLELDLLGEENHFSGRIAEGEFANLEVELGVGDFNVGNTSLVD